MLKSQNLNPKLGECLEDYLLQGSIDAIHFRIVHSRDEYNVLQCEFARNIYRSEDINVAGCDEWWRLVVLVPGEEENEMFRIWVERTRSDTKLGNVLAGLELKINLSNILWQVSSRKVQLEDYLYEVNDKQRSTAIYSIPTNLWPRVYKRWIFPLNKGYFKIDFKIQLMPLAYGLSLQSKFVRDLNTLFDEQTLGDVIVSVRTHQFKVYGGMLSARSPVFAAMLTSDLAESRNNTINIEDIRGEIVREMLRYIYTGSIPQIEKYAVRLLAAGEKYLMPDLKRQCSQYLAANISVENAVDILVAAHLYNSEKLKEKVLCFITLNSKQVKESVQWKTVMPQHPDLMMEVCIMLM